MQTIVELPEFQKRAVKLLKDEEKTAIINYLAVHPHSGIVMKGTGGVRKLRWAANARGKSAGFRVIYYHYNETKPLFLLSLFGKNEQSNISPAERNELASLTRILVQHYEDK